MDGTGSEACSIVSLGFSDIECSSSTARELFNL
jgi:hypothetical protein